MSTEEREQKVELGGRVLSVEEARALDVEWKEGPAGLMTAVYEGQRVFLTKENHAKLEADVGPRSFQGFPLSVAIADLPIRPDGKRELLDTYKSPADVIEAGEEKLVEISGIGPVLAGQIIEVCRG